MLQRAWLIPVVLLLSPLMVRAADSLVLDPGEKKTIPLKRRSMEILRPRRGDVKKTNESMSDLRVTPDDGKLFAAIVNGRAFRFEAPSKGGRRWKIAFKTKVREEVYRRVGRRYQWVHRGYRTRNDEFDVVVDIDDLPQVEVLLGTQIPLAFPKTCRLHAVDSSREKIAQASLTEHLVHIIGLQPGKSRLKIEYVIGEEKFTKRCQVKVVDEKRIIELEIPVGSREEIQHSDIELVLEKSPARLRHLNVRMENAIVKVEKTPLGSSLTALAPGKIEIEFIYLAGKRKPCQYPIYVQITVPEGAPRSP